MKGETILSEVFLVASTISPDIETIETVETQKPWIVIVWNDPINLMSYVSMSGEIVSLLHKHGLWATLQQD